MTWVTLLRGVNVGGHGKLPMAELRTHLSNLGLLDVQTYIQSGNIVFEAANASAGHLDARIGQAIEENFGFKPAVMTIALTKFQELVKDNPYPATISEPKTLHFYFLRCAAESPDFTALDKWKTEDESYTLTDGVFYLHAPSGIGRSKLAARVEKLLGVEATARNWRTVDKILSLAVG